MQSPLHTNIPWYLPFTNKTSGPDSKKLIRAILGSVPKYKFWFRFWSWLKASENNQLVQKHILEWIIAESTLYT